MYNTFASSLALPRSLVSLGPLKPTMVLDGSRGLRIVCQPVFESWLAEGPQVVAGRKKTSALNSQPQEVYHEENRERGQRITHCAHHVPRTPIRSPCSLLRGLGPSTYIWVDTPRILSSFCTVLFVLLYSRLWFRLYNDFPTSSCPPGLNRPLHIYSRSGHSSRQRHAFSARPAMPSTCKDIYVCLLRGRQLLQPRQRPRRSGFHNAVLRRTRSSPRSLGVRSMLQSHELEVILISMCFHSYPKSQSSLTLFSRRG